MEVRPSEPSNVKQYRARKVPFAGRLFTCARPGRSLGRKTSPISDDTVVAWVLGLPRSDHLHIVSLLGTKPCGRSEYSYYSFRGGRESSALRPKSPTFQEWLDLRFGPDRFIVIDFPTVDTKSIEPTMLSEICRRVNSLLDSSADVLLVDSGGEGRTGKVCAALGTVATPYWRGSRAY